MSTHDLSVPNNMWLNMCNNNRCKMLYTWQSPCVECAKSRLQHSVSPSICIAFKHNIFSKLCKIILKRILRNEIAWMRYLLFRTSLHIAVIGLYFRLSGVTLNSTAIARFIMIGFRLWTPRSSPGT